MSIRDSISKLETHNHGCACEGDTACHGHGNEEYDMTAGSEALLDKLLLVRILASAVLFALALVLPIAETIKFIMLVVSALVCGYDIYISAAVNIVKKRMLDECLLMAVASIAAFVIGEDHEGAAVMLLYQIGELLQNYAVNRTKRSVSELMDLKLNSATLISGDEEKLVHSRDIRIGDTILVRTGERVPVDCAAPEGGAVLDVSAITGDSELKRVQEGDIILSGSVNAGSAFRAEAAAIAEDSTASRIVSIVEEEDREAGSTEKFITRFARIYTPIVIGLAVLVAVLMPLLTKITFAEGVHRALVFLVIACPCALVISVPLSYFAGIGGASRLGILFKSAMAVDNAAKTRAVVFDKTGTLTTGKFRVTSVKSEKMEADMLLKVAAHAMAYSNTAISKAIIDAYGDTIYIELIQNFTETPGKGISVTVDNIPIILGTSEYLKENGVDTGSDGSEGRAVYAAVSGIYAGRICLEDSQRADAASAMSAIREAGIYDAVMVSDDPDPTGAAIARSTGIGEYHLGCTAAEKADHVAEAEKVIAGKGTVMFVGSGENDSEALTQADTGVVMGGLGSAAAINAADIVIMDDSPMKVAAAIQSAHSMRRIIYENLAFIFAIKLTVLILGFFGISAVWFAVFADVGVALAASLNSIRAYYLKAPGSK